MKGMTSSKTGNFPFKKVHETGVCECGEVYESSFTLLIQGEEKEITQTQCFKCQMAEEERKLSRSILKANQKQRMKNIQTLFEEESLINPKLRNATFEDYHPTNQGLMKAKSILQRYANNFSKENPVSLLLIGNYGTGKSHLSVAAIKELMKKNYTCLFISTPKLLSKIRSTYNKSSEHTEEKIIETLTKVDCLVLDDIGSEQSKQQTDINDQSWATSKLFEIIDNRIGKHTIYTTNFETGELQQRLGGRNFSRMMEDVTAIEMYGDDYRLKNFKQGPK